MSRRRVGRLLREAGLRARALKLYRRIPGLHGFFTSIHNRQLDRLATGPDQVWVGDITYLKVAAGWQYLAVVMDRYSRRIIGWSLGAAKDARLTLAALNHAVRNRRPRPYLPYYNGVRLHSGIGYASLGSGPEDCSQGELIVGSRVKAVDFQRLNLRCHALPTPPRRGRYDSLAEGPVAASRRTCALFGDRRPPNLAVRGWLRSVLPSVRWDDERYNPSSYRTSIALLKPIARSLRLLRGLARVGFECSTSWVRKPLASFAMRPFMLSWRSPSRQTPGDTRST